ncbi:hypothetical protein, partial [Akkermansia sp.]|uniref:hypothetical protein n=1 Tax=Akkermansia sp. TaxID=1872421 RepID=UPI0025C4EB38
HAQQHYLVRAQRYAQEKRPIHSRNLIDPGALTTCDMAFIQGQAPSMGLYQSSVKFPLPRACFFF